MVTIETAKKLALQFPETEVKDHFGRPSFRVRKKIFATIGISEKQMVVKLTSIDQSVFIDFNNEIFHAATGAWGKQGWTIVELKKVRKDMLTDAVTLSWKNVAPKKLVALL
jgi:hypothetical protein